MMKNIAFCLQPDSYNSKAFAYLLTWILDVITLVPQILIKNLLITMVRIFLTSSIVYKLLLQTDHKDCSTNSMIRFYWLGNVLYQSDMQVA
jgi:hypothetical protein